MKYRPHGWQMNAMPWVLTSVSTSTLTECKEEIILSCIMPVEKNEEGCGREKIKSPLFFVAYKSG